MMPVSHRDAANGGAHPELWSVVVLLLTRSPERSDGYTVPFYGRGGAGVVATATATATAAADALIDPYTTGCEPVVLEYTYSK